MVDSRNYFSSWRVSFKKASEVNSVVNFIRELVKVFNFQTRDPEFGFTESFKACGGKYQPLGFPNLLRSIWRGSSGVALAVPLITVLSKVNF